MKNKKLWKQYVEEDGLIKLEKESGKEASKMFFKGTKEVLMTMMTSALRQLYVNDVLNEHDIKFIAPAVLEGVDEDESK